MMTNRMEAKRKMKSYHLRVVQDLNIKVNPKKVT